MKLLLTSSGISNPSIYAALVDLLGKPIVESSALFVPTAIYPFPDGQGKAFQAISGKAKSPLCELGWKSLGVLELTALASIEKEVWAPTVQESDALLVWGGDPVYLSYWMKQSGLAESPAVLAARDGLRRGERREHRDDLHVRGNVSWSGQMQRGTALVRRHRVR